MYKGVSKIAVFSTNISLYLRNDTRYVQCDDTDAGVCEVRTCDVRTMSCLRPATDTHHSDEERRPCPTFYVDDAARLAPERGRRSAVRAHSQLHSSAGDDGQRAVQL